MKTVRTYNDLSTIRKALPGPVGLVPTMGYLHSGHISLVEAARKGCQSVVVSIFVNPTQFGPQEDLSAYPRDLPRDLELLENAGADLVWTPDASDMYPPGFQTWVNVEEVSRPLEGAMRPGHFKGVTTVVAKLFNTVQPDRVYFGQKDAQQAAVIRQMIRDLNYPVEMVVCPIVREPDGLAMSSRNVYLSPAQRGAAPVLYRSLCSVQEAYQQGEHNAERLRSAAAEVLAFEPLANVQYISVSDPDSLQEIETVTGRALVSMAVYFDRTRLIDNIILGE